MYIQTNIINLIVIYYSQKIFAKQLKTKNIYRCITSYFVNLICIIYIILQFKIKLSFLSLSHKNIVVKTSNIFY